MNHLSLIFEYGADGLTTSVNGVTQVGGSITLTKSDIGLSNVDNTTDAAKPISTTTQTALDLKVDKDGSKALSTNDFTDTDKNNLDANTAKVGYTEALVSANTDVAANTAKVGVTNGTVAGQMQYWNGSAWVVVAPTSNEGATLQMIGGVPTWTGGTPPTPNVTNPTTGEIWMDRNLGASQVATRSTDAASYGDLYQWGRDADGHQISTSGTTTNNATTPVPNGGNPWDGLFITEGSSPNDWLTPQDDNLWQGVSGTNNPCPSGYRLPTEAEWDAERTSWSSGNNSAGAFASPLKLPVAGSCSGSNGSLNFVGTRGGYWSSTVSSADSRFLSFGSGDAGMDAGSLFSGRSVRCLKD
ncbi:MAG: hypothetical protein O2887_18550 [Bacteroidetes bacterium]|nr:hypothetical protein [Bacteroidota bacterium]MDA1122456.1 hypothetical protein [Bacteroidota bacterium]